MNKFGVLIAGAALSSCASVGELRDRPPIVDVVTQKSVSQVVGCVTEKWSRQKGATINTMMTTNGMVVSIGWFYYSTPITETVLEVTDEGPYRRVKLISRFKKLKPKSVEAYRSMLQPCLV